MCPNGICGPVSVNILVVNVLIDSWSASQWILGRHSTDFSVDTPSIVGYSWLSVNRLLTKMLIESQSRFNGLLIEYRLTLFYTILKKQYLPGNCLKNFDNSFEKWILNFVSISITKAYKKFLICPYYPSPALKSLFLSATQWYTIIRKINLVRSCSLICSFNNSLRII